jgi:hypothetical protein
MITFPLFRPRVRHALLYCFMAIASVASGQLVRSEFEGMPVVEKEGSQVHVQWNSLGRSGINYEAAATGDVITYWLNIPEPGDYDVWVCHRRYNNRGKVQHAVNGTNFGAVYDGYLNSSDPNDPNLYQRIKLGTFTFQEPGIKSFQMKCTGTGAGGGRIISVDYLEFQKLSSGSAAWEYATDFENVAAGQSPSHWIETNTADEWKVDSSTGSKTYRHGANTTSTVTWLHVFERDVEVTARVMFKSKLSGSRQVRLLARYNHEEACVMAGYDFNPNGPPRWHIMDRRDPDDSWHIISTATASEYPPMVENQWYTLKLVVRGNDTALYVDDMQHPVLFAKGEVTHVSHGRVGLMADGVEAYFDDVKVQLVHKHGRVQDGVLEYTILPNDQQMREGATFVAMNGKIELLHRRERFTSTDNGQTFTGPTSYGTIPDDKHSHTSVLRLNSGKLLKVQGEYSIPVGQANSQTPLRFRARRSSDEGQTWDMGGLTWTTPRVGGDGATEVIQMNDKLSQSSSGRVFFGVTARRYSGTSVVGHKCEVYYSDDEGATWAKAAGDTSIWDTDQQWSRIAEAKVIPTSTANELRFYTTWISGGQGTDGYAAGSMRYFTSTNNGLTWSNDTPANVFKCARSSFGIDRDMNASGLVYYMVWCFSDPADGLKHMFPRSRLGLAKSTDGKNWTYLMDVERWVSRNDPNNNPIVQLVDPGIMVTPTHLFVTTGLSDRDDPETTHNALKLRVYRIDKSKLTPWVDGDPDSDNFPNEF